MESSLRQQLDVQEFHQRWKAACSAVSQDQDRVLKHVFDNSFHLGRSAARYLGRALSLHEIITLLQASDIPCLSGNWTQGDVQLEARLLRREGCREKCSAQRCDYWREAIDGLVMGLGDEARFARHRSQGHGDSECVDVFFTEDQQSLRWGRVPDEIRGSIESIQERFPQAVQLSIAGYSEGILFYTLNSSTSSLCGAGGKLLHDTFSRAVAEQLPGVRLQDVSPVGVYDRRVS